MKAIYNQFYALEQKYVINGYKISHYIIAG